MKSKPGWKRQMPGGSADGKREGRRQQTSRINPLHGSKERMTSISKTSAFGHEVPPRPGPHQQAWALAAEQGLEASWPLWLRWHMGTQPEAATRCTHSPSPSLNRPVDVCTSSAGKEHDPQAPGGRGRCPRTATLPSILLLFPHWFSPRRLPLHHLCRQKSSWPPQTKPPSRLTQPSRALTPGRKVGTRLAELRRSHTGCSW